MYIDVGIANKGKCQCTPVPLTASAYTLSRRICIFIYFYFFSAYIAYVSNVVPSTPEPQFQCYDIQTVNSHQKITNMIIAMRWIMTSFTHSRNDKTRPAPPACTLLKYTNISTLVYEF